MKPIYADLKHNSDAPLYVQLYDIIRSGILGGDMRAGERLPSLRSLSAQLDVSITTCARAYDQLYLEGYLDARPNSGYYVRKVTGPDRTGEKTPLRETADNPDTPGIHIKETESTGTVSGDPAYRCDPESFDFSKWRKCFTWVMNNSPEVLLSPQDPQGEYDLRKEISGYLYTARGVTASPEDIVIGAGVQQLTSRLAKMLREFSIDIINVEDPGYRPVRHIFRDMDFTLNKIPVGTDGLEIEKLPENIETAVYVSPSNQFPTGSVMPADRRYQLLEWARRNSSVIIEDDYDSELRYFGNPVPALKNIDSTGCVVYLGSFSSTLFPAIRISYMVLPERLSILFRGIRNEYDQTCSKIEQLVLAEFMKNGFYQAGIRKIRKLYAGKLDKLIEAFTRYGGDIVHAENTKSGISIRLEVMSACSPSELCEEAEKLRLHIVPVHEKTRTPGKAELILYYDQIPLNEINEAVRGLCSAWA
ncbi:MAG: PLP-dependent aminotransferase family protein [Eubacterium sp.]|nr:PLP-dependent aminotransferase family protein [Eubacterium sp.]